MPKNVLIYGGYNWFGFEIINALIKENSFTNFILVDSFQNHLWKDSIRDKMDQYRYLYDENIFLWSVDIKDKYKLEHIYKTYPITHVINNIKYNHNDVYMMEKVEGYRNILKFNKQYNIQSYICLYRTITHNSFALNHDQSDHVLISDTFNQCVKEINGAFADSHHTLHEMELYDYVYGSKKDKYNDIVSMYKNIIQCRSPCYVHKCAFYMQHDEEVVQWVLDRLLGDSATSSMITRRCYQYIQLYETIYFHMTQDCKDRDKLIKNDTALLEYIGVKDI